MSLTLKNSIIRSTQAEIKNEVTINIVENYDHEKYSKPQIIWCDLPCVIFENKDLKEYFDNLLSDSGITYREQGMIFAEYERVMRISMRIPAHFYSDKPIPKKRTKKKKAVEETSKEVVDTSAEDTTPKE